MASAKDFKVAGVDREYHLTSLQFQVDFSNPAQPSVRVTSPQPINEPYLDFLVELEWPSGKLLREYTLLLDLPNFVSEKVAPRQVSSATQSTRPSSAQTQPSRSRAPLPAAGEAYTVQGGNTLWSIAQQSRPSGYSINETINAIYQLNPAAFINNDINLLKKGAVIRLPEGSQIENLASRLPAASAASAAKSTTAPASVDRSSAADSTSSDIDRSSQPVEESQGGRLKLASLATDDAADSGSGETTGAAIDGGAESGAGRISSLEETLGTTQEELARSQRENEDLKERLANLEEQLGTLDRMAELQSETGAALQAEKPQQPKPTPPPAQTSSKDKGLSWLLYPFIVLAGLLIGAFLYFRNRNRDDEDDFQSVIIPQEKQRQEPVVAEPVIAEKVEPTVDLADEEESEDFIRSIRLGAGGRRNHRSP